MEIGLVRKVDIDHEMQQSYLDYAMSVIVSRALPDARDGLKPVQRRILYAMYDMGLRPNSDYKKSARIVGEVLGKYHPHGDMAVYEAMARLAQDFTMRNPLVDGQGNFGSVDGDPPAAMRYTEARLAPFSIEILNQLDRDTVNFTPNFDGTLSEPDVLPAAVPNLLVNGASGIAVGMATNIPPHNLAEVIDALTLLLHEWERIDDIAIPDLMKYVQGPDFPTGGIILEEHGQNELLSAYATGRGRVIVRGRVHAEEMSRGRNRLIITELPYQVNKSALIERIAELVREGTLEGIADLRDESDRHGMRIVIELKQGVEAEDIVSGLYRRTPLETTFGINMLALVNGEPHLLSLKHALKVYIEHRLEVVQRRSEFDLKKARQRLHILEGLRIALKNLDEIIALIKSAVDAEDARQKLIRRYKLSDLQSQAILDMQLRRLASLERKKIELEYKELEALVKDLEALLKSPERMRRVVEEELLAMRQAYAEKRRTQIVSLKDGESSKALLMTSDITPAQTVWVGITQDGIIARTNGDSLPRLSGRAAPRWLLRTDTHHTLYLAAEDGRTAAVAVSSIPESEQFSDGVPMGKVSMFEDGERLVGLFSVPPKDELPASDRFILTVTRLGMVKKSAVAELPGPSAQRFILVKVNPSDSLDSVVQTDGNDEILLVTAQAMAIRFPEQEVRPMGLAAAGVNGIKLYPADAVVGLEKAQPDAEILLVSTAGKGWRLPYTEFPTQGRYGQGVQIGKVTPGTRLVALLSGKKNQNGILHFKQAAARTIRVDEAPLTRRLKSIHEIVPVKPGDEVTGITRLADSLALWGGMPQQTGKVEPPTEPVPEILFEQDRQLSLESIIYESAMPPNGSAGSLSPTKKTVEKQKAAAPVARASRKAKSLATAAPTSKKQAAAPSIEKKAASVKASSKVKSSSESAVPFVPVAKSTRQKKAASPAAKPAGLKRTTAKAAAKKVVSRLPTSEAVTPIEKAAKPVRLSAKKTSTPVGASIMADKKESQKETIQSSAQISPSSEKPARRSRKSSAAIPKATEKPVARKRKSSEVEPVKASPARKPGQASSKAESASTPGKVVPRKSTKVSPAPDKKPAATNRAGRKSPAAKAPEKSSTSGSSGSPSKPGRKPRSPRKPPEQNGLF